MLHQMRLSEALAKRRLEVGETLEAFPGRQEKFLVRMGNEKPEKLFSPERGRWRP